MKLILQLRLKTTFAENITIIVPDIIWDGSLESSKILLDQLAIHIDNISLTVLNLYGKHWIGLIIEIDQKIINISYFDSEQNNSHQILEEQLVKYFSNIYHEHEVIIQKSECPIQQYNNCGPEVIENIVASILQTERTISQEDAIAIHSTLVEDFLMGET